MFVRLCVWIVLVFAYENRKCTITGLYVYYLYIYIYPKMLASLENGRIWTDGWINLGAANGSKAIFVASCPAGLHALTLLWAVRQDGWAPLGSRRRQSSMQLKSLSCSSPVTEGGEPGYCAIVAIRIDEVTSISGCKRRTLPCVVEEVVSSDAFGSTKNRAANQEKAHFHSFLTFLIDTSIDVVIVFALQGRFVLKAGKYSKRKRA